MRTIFAAVVGCVLVISSVNVYADAGYFSGNELQQRLADKKERVRYAHALGYIVGVVYMTSGVSICTPQEATGEQIIDIVNKYLADHPQKLHIQARALVIDALSAAFPCR